MRMLYYLEINLSCLTALILLYSGRSRRTTHSIAEHLEQVIIYLVMLFCLADLGTWVFDGSSYHASRVLLNLSNIFYYIISSTIPYAWMCYVILKNGSSTMRIKKVAAFSSFLLCLFSLLTISSPWTGLVFTVDELGVYCRGPLVYTHWIVAFAYAAAAVYSSINSAMHTASAIGRSETVSLTLFCVLPLISAIVQILIPGSTLIQVGFTLTITFFFSRERNELISTDSLTGINNRSQLDRYLTDRFVNTHSEEVIFLIMIDINDFKNINDSFGHLMGDEALKDLANIMKKVGGNLQRGLFLARYGGDEFVICGMEKNGLNAELVLLELEKELTAFNKDRDLPFNISISAGIADGSITNLTATELIRRADASMYNRKRTFKHREVMR